MIRGVLRNGCLIKWKHNHKGRGVEAFCAYWRPGLRASFTGNDGLKKWVEFYLAVKGIPAEGSVERQVQSL